MSLCLLRIATRQSPLALWQAEHVAARLRAQHAGLAVELLPLVTQGDRLLGGPLAQSGGKGLFVKELEWALLEGRAELAVHSLKDVPAELPAGLALPVVLAREDAADAFVSNRYGALAQLPPGARVGTASLRRQCQLLALRPDLLLHPLRGNVNTRLARLDSGEYDAIVLAAAGLARLGLAARIARRFDAAMLLPAIGQGVLALECRTTDAAVLDAIQPLHDPATAACIAAERALNAALGGSCQVPVAGHAVLESESLWLRGLVGAPDGQYLVRGEIRGPAEDAAALGRTLAARLLAEGARDILIKLAAGPYGDQTGGPTGGPSGGTAA